MFFTSYKVILTTKINLKLNEEEWKFVVRSAPIYAMDLIIFSKEKGILLGKRKNNPAKGFYFVPGGRIYKNEKRDLGFKRISTNEIGVTLDFTNSELIDIFEHFYNTSKWSHDEISTHYIVEARLININSEVEKNITNSDNQHSDFIWVKDTNIQKIDVHPYCKPYLNFVFPK